ncbi:hypothetical protein AKO1_007848 [Acrasis kona]|uniref:Zn(2)-C6 fungal-type domain-containing protein n=1 Tax=Acrasis kona TaxID=1008807 RepID=A0AAW2YNP3_9EUKA
MKTTRKKLPTLVTERVRSGRKPYVKNACTNCKTAHTACEDERPCSRCRLLNIGDSCMDATHKYKTRSDSTPNIVQDDFNLINEPSTKKRKAPNTQIATLNSTTQPNIQCDQDASFEEFLSKFLNNSPCPSPMFNSNTALAISPQAHHNNNFTYEIPLNKPPSPGLLFSQDLMDGTMDLITQNAATLDNHFMHQNIHANNNTNTTTPKRKSTLNQEQVENLLLHMWNKQCVQEIKINSLQEELDRVTDQLNKVTSSFDT